jgi:hypothetical protein
MGQATTMGCYWPFLNGSTTTTHALFVETVNLPAGNSATSAGFGFDACQVEQRPWERVSVTTGRSLKRWLSLLLLDEQWLMSFWKFSAPGRNRIPFLEYS